MDNFQVSLVWKSPHPASEQAVTDLRVVTLLNGRQSYNLTVLFDGTSCKGGNQTDQRFGRPALGTRERLPLGQPNGEPLHELS